MSEKDFLKIENKIYKEEKIDNSIKEVNILLKNIVQRNPICFEDRTYNLPQAIFFIYSYKGYTIFGRKIRSILSFKNKINAFHCSMITSSMLLGFLKSEKQIGEKILIDYYPFTPEEKLTVFNSIKLDNKIDIVFPYKYIDFITRREEESPPEGWDLNPDKVLYLGDGEKHIREYTIFYLKKNKLVNKNTIIFDPACSTGEFLYSIKKAFPFCKTIGQDLSKEMVDYAKKFVDEIYCGDSIKSIVKEKSVDILFFRFLNSEVVSTEYAHKLFDEIIKKVKVGGLIIAFGHTPLLINREYFVNKKFKVLKNFAYDINRECIFQYYVLRR